MGAALSEGGTDALFRQVEIVDGSLTVESGVEVQLLPDDGLADVDEEGLARHAFKRNVGLGGIKFFSLGSAASLVEELFTFKVFLLVVHGLGYLPRQNAVLARFLAVAQEVIDGEAGHEQGYHGHEPGDDVPKRGLGLLPFYLHLLLVVAEPRRGQVFIHRLHLLGLAQQRPRRRNHLAPFESLAVGALLELLHTFMRLLAFAAPCVRLGHVTVGLGAIEVNVSLSVFVGRFAVGAIAKNLGVLLVVSEAVDDKIGNGDNIGLGVVLL